VSTRFEVESIGQLLNIARKVQLIDLDLTDFLRVNCKHLTSLSQSSCEKSGQSSPKKDDSNDTPATTTQQKLCFNWTKCSCSNAFQQSTDLLAEQQQQQQQQTQHDSNKILEEKFAELFLKRFNQLPGYNNLFIFSRTAPNCALQARDSEDVPKFFSSEDLPGDVEAAENESDQSDFESDSSFDSDSDDNLSILANAGIDILYEDKENSQHQQQQHQQHQAQRNSNSISIDDRLKSGHGAHHSAANRGDYDHIELLDLGIDELSKDGATERTLVEQNGGTSNGDADHHRFSAAAAARRRRRKRQTTAMTTTSRPSYNKSSHSFETLSRLMSITSAAASDGNYNANSNSYSNSIDSLASEQIVGLEFVCVIGNGAAQNAMSQSTSVANAAAAAAKQRPRTRTTTLTSRDNPDESASYDFNANEPVSFTGTAYSDLPPPPTPLPSLFQAAPHQQPNLSGAMPASMIGNQFGTWKFYVKFKGFNFCCLMDLIDSCDSYEVLAPNSLLKSVESRQDLSGSQFIDAFEEFRNLINILEINESKKATSNNINSNELTLNDVKIYLRFNYYSFDEFNNQQQAQEEPFAQHFQAANLMSNSNINNQQQSSGATANQMFTQYANSSLATSLTDRSKLLTSPSQPVLQTQISLGAVSNLSASTTSLLAAQNRFSISSASQFFVQPTTGNTSSTGTIQQQFYQNAQQQQQYQFMLLQNQLKFEYNHILSPSLREFEWYLRDYVQLMDATAANQTLVK